jgi:hypothetical protein
MAEVEVVVTVIPDRVSFCCLDAEPPSSFHISYLSLDQLGMPPGPLLVQLHAFITWFKELVLGDPSPIICYSRRETVPSATFLLASYLIAEIGVTPEVALAPFRTLQARISATQTQDIEVSRRVSAFSQALSRGWYDQSTFNPDTWTLNFSQLIIPSVLLTVTSTDPEAQPFKDEIAQFPINQVVGSPLPGLPNTELPFADDPDKLMIAHQFIQLVQRHQSVAIHFPGDLFSARLLAIIYLGIATDLPTELGVAWIGLTANPQIDPAESLRLLRLARESSPQPRRVSSPGSGPVRKRSSTMAPARKDAGRRATISAPQLPLVSAPLHRVRRTPRAAEESPLVGNLDD